MYNEIDKVKEVEAWPSRYIPTPTEAEVDLMEQVVKAFKYAFEECPEGFYINIYGDGSISEPKTGGGLQPRIELCDNEWKLHIAFIHGWSAIDLPYIYDAAPDGTAIEGKVWDAEARKWRPNVFDEFLEDIGEWVTEVYDRFEVSHE